MPNHREFLLALAKSEPGGRTLSEADLVRLKKGFAQTKGEEPTNTGIEQNAGMHMVTAAAENSEKRQSKKKVPV